MSHTLDFKSWGSNKDAGSNWSGEAQSPLAQTITACRMTFGSERKHLFTKQYPRQLLKLSPRPSISERRSSHPPPQSFFLLYKLRLRDKRLPPPSQPAAH